MGVLCFKIRLTNRHFFPRGGTLRVQRVILLRHVYFCQYEIHSFYFFLTVFKTLTLPTVIHYCYTVVQFFSKKLAKAMCAQALSAASHPLTSGVPGAKRRLY